MHNYITYRDISLFCCLSYSTESVLRKIRNATKEQIRNPRWLADHWKPELSGSRDFAAPLRLRLLKLGSYYKIDPSKKSPLNFTLTQKKVIVFTVLRKSIFKIF